jgi:DNA repair protein RecN (Recombination protein N)
VIREIRIQNLGVIDDAVLELHPGLNVLTGETGAGKTMVVSGLGLLLGARADSGLVRSGSAKAVVEGLVEVPSDHPASVRAAEAGADVGDGLVLVRTVSAEGGSRAHVGGRSAPVSVLTELGQQLVAVHGQADQWRLRQADQHRALLDHFAADRISGPLERYQDLYDDLTAAERSLADLHAAARERAREIDVLQMGLEQIAAVDPQPGEDTALRLEDERLSHAESLRAAAGTAHEHLAGNEDYGAQDAPSVAALVAAARGAVGAVVEHDPALRDLEGRLADLGYLTADLGADLAAYAAGVEGDAARLGWVQQRRADLSALTRKYGDTADDVLDWGRSAAARLDQLTSAEESAEALQERVLGLRERVGAAAAELSAARAAAAADLAAQVTGELGHLAMGKAFVEVAVRPREAEEGLAVPGRPGPVRASRHGTDDVEVLLSPNPGSPARSVARVASGGELSRVMLALEVATAGAGRADVPTFVFDEVDAGVGGRAALDLGARLARLAEHAQVIVVTHLPQVAAFAHRHLVVAKATDGHVTSSGVSAMSGDERLREVARMMAGADSETALAHARELLERASSRTAPGRSAARAGA